MKMRYENLCHVISNFACIAPWFGILEPSFFRPPIKVIVLHFLCPYAPYFCDMANLQPWHHRIVHQHMSKSLTSSHSIIASFTNTRPNLTPYRSLAPHSIYPQIKHRIRNISHTSTTSNKIIPPNYNPKHWAHPTNQHQTIQTAPKTITPRTPTKPE